jgi:hypothetical protein
MLELSLNEMSNKNSLLQQQLYTIFTILCLYDFEMECGHRFVTPLAKISHISVLAHKALT